MLADGTDNACRSVASDTECHTALAHIRTRNIQLNRRNMLQLANPLGTLHIIIQRRTADIDNHVRANILYLRINLFTKVIYTLVLKSHTIEHTRSRFSHARIIVSFARMECRAFYDNASQLV